MLVDISQGGFWNQTVSINLQERTMIIDPVSQMGIKKKRDTYLKFLPGTGNLCHNYNFKIIIPERDLSMSIE